MTAVCLKEAASLDFYLIAQVLLISFSYFIAKIFGLCSYWFPHVSLQYELLLNNLACDSQYMCLGSRSNTKDAFLMK